MKTKKKTRTKSKQMDGSSATVSNQDEMMTIRSRKDCKQKGKMFVNNVFGLKSANNTCEVGTVWKITRKALDDRLID
jgi:hypothetical protein